MTPVIKEILNEAAMKAFGERFGKHLRGGEVIELIGDVGAGKTTFVKGTAKGLSVDEDVQSPSFTISRVYDARDDLRLQHYDFYRLNDAGILADELAEAIADPKAITIIEWADVVGGVLPDEHISITITSPTETTRTLAIEGAADDLIA
jgi:tRNA threonylcarbamoyladenosine biosynthesis protein TsaE